MENIDLEEAWKDIDDVLEEIRDPTFEELCKSVSGDEIAKLEAFKRTTNRLKDLYLKSDIEDFCEEYEDHLTTRDATYSSYKEKLMALKDALIPYYKPDDYSVISEEEWNRKREEGFTVQKIKLLDKDLMKTVEKKVKQSVIQETLFHTEEANSSPQHDQKFVLIGKTGVGKSAAGNLLIGKKDYFTVSQHVKSSTKTVCCGKSDVRLDGRHVLVLDTPGLFDTERTDKAMCLEYAKCFADYSDFFTGNHAILLVLNGAAPRYTVEEQRAVDEMKEIFGEKAFNHCLLLFTHFDDMLMADENVNATQYVENIQNKKLKTLIKKKLAGRMMFIDNRAKSEYERELYRANLISMADKMLRQRDHGTSVQYEIMEKAEKRLQKFKEMETKLQKREIQVKIYQFYKAVLEVRLFLRQDLEIKQSLQSYDKFNNTPLLDTLVRYIIDSKELKNKIKILHAVPGILKNICQLTVKNILSSSNRNLFSFTYDEEDFVSYSFLCTFEGSDVVGDLNQHLQKHFEKENLQNERDFDNNSTQLHIRRFLKSEVMENGFKTIEEHVKIITSKIFKVTHEHLLLHPMTSENISLLEANQNHMLAESIVNNLNTLTNNIPFATLLFSKEEAVKITKEYIFLKFAMYEDIAKKLEPKDEGDTCFPSNAFVYSIGQTKCLISELKVGDKILTVIPNGNFVYEDVILLGHADHLVETFHISFTVSSGENICISPLHMMHVGEFNNLVPANKIQIGDKLPIRKMDGCKWEKVTSISRSLERGLFCPHTASGSIIVNNVLVSCYTKSLNPKLAHLIISAVGFLYRILPFKVYQYLYGKKLNDTPRLLDFFKPFVLNVVNPFLAGFTWSNLGSIFK